MTPCQQCGGPRKMPAKFQAPREVYELDEFCTRKCCEEFHGIVVKPSPTVSA